MIDRRKFDVSAEAFLMRVVKTTSEPALMFCASPIESAGGARPSYRIDYSVGSKSAPAVIPSGVLIPSNSVVYTCTAIGQTNHATESWVTETKLMVECVGIPGFAGTMFPRIAGIVRFRGQDAEKDALDFVHGNVLKPVGAGPKVICQLVNDQARVWGGGVARAAAQTYPGAQKQFSEWLLQIPRRERLGQVHFADISGDTFIASLIAQEGFGASSSPRIRYAPLERCFSAVMRFALDHKASVHLPRIGTGQSGGVWDTVEEIIRDTLVARGLSVTVYDLPPRRQAIGSALLI
jgi:O-acetyl-ADP-ribose deacetylase (regulator of RNase III)